MKKSYKILKQAIDKVGVKTVTAKLKISSTLVYKWCQEKEEKDGPIASGAANPLDRIKAVYDMTQDIELINWICQAADGYYVKNPSKEKITSDTKVMKSIHGFIKEFSETLEAISHSYSDKSITMDEAKKIRKEWEDLKRIGEGFVQACELGKFDKTSK